MNTKVMHLKFEVWIIILSDSLLIYLSKVAMKKTLNATEKRQK